MRNLIKKLLLIMLLGGGIAFGLCFFSTMENYNSLVDMMTNSVTYQGVGKVETKELMERVKASEGVPRLIIGDSVANQIYEYRNNEEYDVMCGNMAMTLIWQYIFVNEYLENNPETKEVILCVVPEILVRNFEVERTYSYALIPMLEAGKEEVLQPEDIDDLSAMYGSIFIKPSVIHFVGASGLNTKLFLNGVKKFYGMFPKLQDAVEKKGDMDIALSERYILRIKELCEKNGVKFTLLPNPMKNTPENHKKLKELEEVYRNSPLYFVNTEFFDQVIFFEPEHFKDDLHFKDEFFENGVKNQIIEQVQKATGSLEGLLK